VVLDNQRLRELSEIEFTLTSSRQESRYPLFHYYFTDTADELSTIFKAGGRFSVSRMALRRPYM
jgi:hypothetical protein